MKRERNHLPVKGLFAVMILLSSVKGYSQNLEFSLHVDPVSSWMGSNSTSYNNEGVRAGISLGLDMVHFFDDNYGIATGIGIINAGGRMSATQEHTMVFNNRSEIVPAGEEMIYNLRYLNIPGSLHLRTNQIGYVTIFTDLGVDLRFLLRSTVDIPHNDLYDELAKKEVYGVNMGWHIAAGIEYELGIKASLITGIGFDEDFFDVTRDLENVLQPEDRTGLRMIRIRFGIKF